MEIEKRNAAFSLSGIGLTEEDIYEAMKRVPGYIDITPADFKELYCIAFQHSIDRFARTLLARDIMVKQVIHVSTGSPLVEIAEILSNHAISGLPVTDGDRKVVGVVSEKDVLSQLGIKQKAGFMSVIAQCLRAGGCISLPVSYSTAGEIMTSPALTIREDANLLEIIELLSSYRINRLPVTDPEGRLLGILARSDIISATSRSGTCPWNISGK